MYDFETLCQEDVSTLIKLHKQTLALKILWNKQWDDGNKNTPNQVFAGPDGLIVQVNQSLSRIVRFDEVVYRALVQKLLNEPDQLEKSMNLGFDIEMLHLTLNEVLINKVEPRDEWIERCTIAIDLLVKLSALKTTSKKTYIPFALGKFTSNKVYPPIEVVPIMIYAIEDYIKNSIDLGKLDRDKDGNVVWPEFLSVQALFCVEGNIQRALFPIFFDKMLQKINNENLGSEIKAVEEAMNTMISTVQKIFQKGQILLGDIKMRPAYNDRDSLRKSKTGRRLITPRWRGSRGQQSSSAYITLTENEH